MCGISKIKTSDNCLKQVEHVQVHVPRKHNNQASSNDKRKYYFKVIYMWINNERVPVKYIPYLNYQNQREFESKWANSPVNKFFSASLKEFLHDTSYQHILDWNWDEIIELYHGLNYRGSRNFHSKKDYYDQKLYDKILSLLHEIYLFKIVWYALYNKKSYNQKKIDLHRCDPYRFDQCFITYWNLVRDFCYNNKQKTGTISLLLITGGKSHYHSTRKLLDGFAILNAVGRRYLTKNKITFYSLDQDERRNKNVLEKTNVLQISIKLDKNDLKLFTSQEKQDINKNSYHENEQRNNNEK